MSTLADDFVTVTEAAALLHVSSSTIRRWIREGELPAYRIGQRRVALRRRDLATIIAPANFGEENRTEMTTSERLRIRRLSLEEQRRGLAALERADRLSKQILARRGGKPFSSSWEVLNALRDERTRQLT
jgi:excisionase family DNA binding protein